MKHNKINNQLIIETAFIEWSQSFFKKTSLSLITKKLKITKPALYRYFKNKNELLLSMRNFLLIKLKELSKSFVEESKKLNPDEIILLFISKNFGFFVKNQHYFMFYVLTILKESYIKNKELNEIYTSIIDVFSDVIKKTNTWIKQDQVEHFFRFLFSTGIYVIFFRLSNNHCVFKNISNDDIQVVINDIYYIVMNGFGTNDINYDIDFEKIENNSKINKDEIKRDKFFDAIAGVVAEYGLWNTTIDKIARKLGFSKSSLYFYFKNKKEMLTNMLIKEIEIKNQNVLDNIKNYNSFEEILYSFITTSASYLLFDKRILLVFDWLHFQNIDFKNLSKKLKLHSLFNIIFKDAIKNKKINLNKFDNDFIYGFLNMQIVKEIYYSININKEITLMDLRHIFYYFLNGILKEKA